MAPNRTSQILDVSGQPFQIPSQNENGQANANRRNGRVKSGSSIGTFSSMNSWFSTLGKSRQSASLLAQDPFSNHPWIFAAAMTQAIVASQAPYTIFVETDEELQRRAVREKKLGRPWRGAPSGSRRRSYHRHINVSLQQKISRKTLEPDLTNPLMDLLMNPNELQFGNDLMSLTFLWMAVRGEVFWVLETESGESPTITGQDPARIWPLGPDLFQPVLSDGYIGELVGWWYCPPVYMNARLKGPRLPLLLTDVVQFKLPNPNNPMRGMSRIEAVATGVEADLMYKEYNRAIVENGGDPGGVLTSDVELTSSEEQEILEKWEQRHKGPFNTKRTALLSDGFSYAPIAMSPKDLEFLDAMKWNREEELAVMGTPKSVLGVTDVLNYATQLGQDFNFWDKNLLPTMQIIETTLDRTLLLNSPDSVVGIFDIRNVEALRAGLSDKIDQAIRLTKQDLHVPPRLAYELVGLDVPTYEGDEDALVPPFVTPVHTITSPEEPEIAEPITPGDNEEDTDEVEEDDEGADVQDEMEEIQRRIDSVEIIRHRRKRRVRTRQADFVKIQGPIEDDMKGRYRSWNSTERRVYMADFEAAASKSRTKAIEDLRGLFDLASAQSRLALKSRPLYTGALDITYNFTLSDIGIPVFELDDPRILEAMQKRERAFVQGTPQTLQNNLNKAIEEGFANGETIAQIRIRVAQVFDIGASTGKSLQVARTETANLMNGLRDSMFEAQGIRESEWGTAQDESVREAHLLFGDSGPHPRGFNYLELTGESGGGILAFPGDPRTSIGSQIILCRCLEVPTA